MVFHRFTCPAEKLMPSKNAGSDRAGESPNNSFTPLRCDRFAIGGLHSSSFAVAGRNTRSIEEPIVGADSISKAFMSSSFGLLPRHAAAHLQCGTDAFVDLRTCFDTPLTVRAGYRCVSVRNSALRLQGAADLQREKGWPPKASIRISIRFEAIRASRS